MTTTPIILADEVQAFNRQYLVDHGTMNLRAAVPCWSPPFPHTWIEYAYKNGPQEAMVGAFVEATTFEDGTTIDSIANHKHVYESDAERELSERPLKWCLSIFFFLAVKPLMQVSLRSCYGAAMLDKDGRLVDLRCIFPKGCGCPPGEEEVTRKGALDICSVVGNTFSFMHCKNVVAVDVTDREGPAEKWLRRMKVPRLIYKTLRIAPMADIVKAHAASEGIPVDKAMHICRGHFRTYGDDSKGLFGKFKGTFWVPSHVRGDMRSGSVIKDYEVGK